MALRDLALPGGRTAPVRCLSVHFARGGGPGGQNVNKVATKVDLRLDLGGLVGILSEDEIARLRAQLAARIDADGWLFVIANEHREQLQNLAAALVRMERLLAGALHQARPRRATRPTAGSRRRRIESKRRVGEKKRARRELE